VDNAISLTLCNAKPENIAVFIILDVFHANNVLRNLTSFWQNACFASKDASRKKHIITLGSHAMDTYAGGNLAGLK
jgi:hypothetical protein